MLSKNLSSIIANYFTNVDISKINEKVMADKKSKSPKKEVDNEDLNKIKLKRHGSSQSY